MPLPFDLDRRWGSDRRKDDKDHDKKKDHEKKKKYKTKTEEQMDKQIEELSRQLLEERQTTRREKLTVARLQRELNKTNLDNNLQRDAIMRDLAEERQSRLDAEKRLKDALLEGESYKSRLEALQQDLTKMQGMLNSVMEYKSKIEQLKEEHGTVVQTLENDLKKCHSHISNLERDNSNLLNECRALESKVGQEDMVKEKTILLERLRLLEAENSALVLENENQREQYEQCLDEVANQVVQALLMQKDLKEECMKLHNRVRELEQQNCNLKCLFERERQCYGPLTPLQGCFQHPVSNLLSPSVNGPSSSPFSAGPTQQGSVPASSSNTSPILIRPGRLPDRAPRPEQLNGGGEGLPADSSRPLCEAAQGSPVHGAKPVLYQLHGSSHLRSPQTRFSATQCNEHINASYKDSSPDSAYPLANGTHPVDSFRLYTQHRTMPDTAMDVLSPQRDQLMYAHNCQAYAEYRRERLSTGSNGHHHQSSMISFNVAENDSSDGAGDILGLEDLEWDHATVSPSSHKHLAEMGKPARHLPNGLVTSPAKALALRNCYTNALAERKLGGSLGCSRESGRNGFSLGEQYTKPFVHAPFHYAQSLLQELKDISSSVKSFESLTLEPKSGVQQKRKASLEIHSPQSRQKVVRSQTGRPPDHIITLSSSEQETVYDAGPTLARTSGESSCSITSSESIETMLEKQASITPFPDSRREECHQAKLHYSEQHKPPSRDTDNRVPCRESQSEKPLESNLGQYYNELNSLSGKAPPSQEYSCGPLNGVQNSGPMPWKAPQSPSRERNVDACQNKDSSPQRKTHAFRPHPDHSPQSPTVQRNPGSRSAAQTVETVAPGRDVSHERHGQIQSPKFHRNGIQNTNEPRCHASTGTKYSQKVSESPHSVSAQPNVAPPYVDKHIQKDLGSTLNAPQSSGAGRNAVSQPKQSRYNERASQPPTSLASNGVYPLGASLSPSVRNNVVQSNAAVNCRDSHPHNGDGAQVSSHSPCSPSRHRNSTFPRPHRHLSEPDSKRHQLVNPSAAPSTIRPPSSLPGELSSPTAMGKHWQSSSAPTSPSNDRLAARAHQRNVARKLSPRVRKADGNRHRQTESKHKISGNESEAPAKVCPNNAAGRKVNCVHENSSRTLTSRENVPSRPSDLIIPSKDIKTDRPPHVIGEQHTTVSSKQPNDQSPKAVEVQAERAIKPETAPATKSTPLQSSDQSTESISCTSEQGEIRPSLDAGCEQESTGDIEDVIIAYSSRDDHEADGTDSRETGDPSSPPQQEAVDTTPKLECLMSLKALEEKTRHSDKSKPKSHHSAVKEVGKKSRDNRVGSFMRATTPPVCIETPSRMSSDVGPKPPITNIDELPVRGFNPPVNAADVPPKSNNQPINDYAHETAKHQDLLKDNTSGLPSVTLHLQTADEGSVEGSEASNHSDEIGPGSLTADKSSANGTKRHSPFHIGTLGSSPRQPGRGQSVAAHQDGPRRLGSDPVCQHSLSYESLQSNQSEGSVDWGSPIRNGTMPKKPATPLSDILWSGSDSDDEEENVNFVEMWKSRSASPMKLPDWNPRKSVEDYKKKIQESLPSTSRSLVRPDSLTSSTSSEQWILNYPYDKVTPPTSLTRPSKSASKKEPARSSSVKTPEPKTEDLKTALRTSKSAPSTKTNGLLKRDTTAICKRVNGGDRVRSSGSDNSSLGENSMMADFVSSIMTEIASDKYGMSCISLDSALTDQKKSPKAGITERHASPSMRAKCNSLPSNQSCFLSLSISNSPKRPPASSEKVTKTQSTPSASKLAKSKSKESRHKSTLSGIPKAITEKNFKFYKGQSSRKTGEEELKRQSKESAREDLNNTVQVKKREPKGRSRIPKLIRNSFRSQKSDHSSKKKTLKGSSKKTLLDDHKIQMTRNVPSGDVECPNPQKWIRRDIRRGQPSPKACSSSGITAADKPSASTFSSEDLPYMDDTGKTSPEGQSAPEKCNLSSSGEQCRSEHSHAHHSGSCFKGPLDGSTSMGSVWLKSSTPKATWNPDLNHADQKLIEDIGQGRLCSDSDCQLSSKAWSPHLNSNNKGSLERSHRAKRPGEGGKEEAGHAGKEYKVPLVNEDMMEDFDAEELCEEGSEGARENSAQLTEKERANLLDSLFESETEADEEEGGESLDTSSDSHPDEKQFLKLLGGERVSGWKRQIVRQQATYCHVSILQLDLHALYMRFGDKEKEALSSFGFLHREGVKVVEMDTPLRAQMNNNANNLQLSLDDVDIPAANHCQDQRGQGLAFGQPFDESLSVSDDVSCYSQSSSTPSLSLHD